MLMRTAAFPSTILYINPHSLDQHTLEPNLKWVVWSALHLPHFVNRTVVFRLKYLLGRKGVFGGNWDLKRQSFSEREEFRLIDDLNRNLPDFQHSVWYRQGREAIENGGTFVHKNLVARTAQQLDEIFADYLVALLETMKQEGYRHRAGADFPGGMIGRDGTLIKTAHGTHRLAAAKATGASGLFPIKVIGVHRLWLSGLRERSGESRNDMIERALRPIEEQYR